MRVGLVSPYSWTYPGGVTRHVEALAAQLRSVGHEVLVLAPFDPDDALSSRLHRGVRPSTRRLPDDINGDGFAVPGTQVVHPPPPAQDGAHVALGEAVGRVGVKGADKRAARGALARDGRGHHR